MDHELLNEEEMEAVGLIDFGMLSQLVAGHLLMTDPSFHKFMKVFLNNQKTFFDAHKAKKDKIAMKSHEWGDEHI